MSETRARLREIIDEFIGVVRLDEHDKPARERFIDAILAAFAGAKVYVVTESTERWSRVVAVYSSREDADARAATEQAGAEFRHEFEVEEHELEGHLRG